jgi:hypothetical protein
MTPMTLRTGRSEDGKGTITLERFNEISGSESCRQCLEFARGNCGIDDVGRHTTGRNKAACGQGECALEKLLHLFKPSWYCWIETYFDRPVL